ncbi:MAG: hypothetical protein KKE16_06245 [Firmicutes bacterium]|nr:hypothetical protein [Bacillota bacterium]
MKKIIIFTIILIASFCLHGCVESEPDLFSIASSLNNGENGISEIIHYYIENVENSYILKFENGDLVTIGEDNSIEYLMPIESDYTSSVISIYGFYSEMDSARAQIVLAIETTPSTGILNDFDTTLERTSLDVTFDQYINSANISQSIPTQLFNLNGLELLARIKNLLENVLNVDYK